MKPKFDNFAEPPGVYIREEIEARGWSQRDLAFILGYTEQTINKVISGKSGITAEMAKALAEAFGTSADLWAGLQKDWELREARDPDPAIKARAQLQSRVPIREMINRSWLAEAEQSMLELQYMRFFEVNRVDDVETVAFAAAAKKTRRVHSHEEVAWLYRVRQLARGMDISAYSEEKLRSILPELRALMIDPEDVRYVPGLLASAGVRFVVVEKLSNCQIDGVCTWLSEDSPAIGITMRHNRLDNFWFVIMHEIEHVLRRHGINGKGIIDDLDGDGASDGEEIGHEERQANSAALNFPFPRQKLLSFYTRKAPYISERDVVGFASLSEVHPAVVVGQLQYLKKDFGWLRKWLVSIRQHLLPESLVDGFGEVAPASL
jgi:HTH-type transcriptional regulator/antitoxin HigA